MKPVMQTDFGQFGNCFSACLASLFELPLEEVPNFFTVAGPYDDAAWWSAVRDWLRPRGYGIMFNDLRDPEHLKLFEGYFIVSGKSSRNVDHATIWKDGVMVHDPHPEQCGLIAPDGVDLIYPLDVSALAALSERGEAGQDKLPGFIKPDTNTRIYFYEQDHYYLSNFSAFKLLWKGIHFATSEQAYHWERFIDKRHKNAIIDAHSAHEAYRYAQDHKQYQRADWDEIKVGVMRDILMKKAEQHEYVRRKLLATGYKELIEDSWRDSYWGWGPNADGLNMLGKLWMEVRRDL